MSITTYHNSDFEYTHTGSKAPLRIQCYGAGGHGASTGSGGSGGGYAEVTLRPSTTTTYFGAVGKATQTDGGTSSFFSEYEVFAQAPGGKLDGTIDHQPSLLTGSVVSTGGRGSSDFTGYSSYNGSSGGTSGGPTGNGIDGVSAASSTRVTGAGIANISGGVGAYYDAGPSVNGVIGATAGQFPGGGGGGGYDYPQGVDSSAPGADGQIILTKDTANFGVSQSAYIVAMTGGFDENGNGYYGEYGTGSMVLDDSRRRGGIYVYEVDGVEETISESIWLNASGSVPTLLGRNFVGGQYNDVYDSDISYYIRQKSASTSSVILIVAQGGENAPWEFFTNVASVSSSIAYRTDINVRNVVLPLNAGYHIMKYSINNAETILTASFAFTSLKFLEPTEDATAYIIVSGSYTQHPVVFAPGFI